MEVERWKELMTVVECKSLTAAANKLGYTLSGVSRSIAALENELGFALFYRGKKGVTPTKECEQMIEYARELIFASEKLSQAAAKIRGAETGKIGIGTAYRHFYRWLTQVTSEFHHMHPGVHFQIYNGTSTEFIHLLDQHAIDFCLISEREGIHEWQPICEDKLIALLPVGHKLAQQQKIALNTFAVEPYIATCPGLDIDSGRFFEKHHVIPNTQFSAMDIQATYAMVDAGMGISLTNQINSLTSYSGICHRDIEPTQMINIGLAWLKDLSPVAASFLKFVLTRLPEEKSVNK